MADPGTAEFILSRVFRAPRQRVWDAWTQPELLARWFGPKGSTCTVLQFELRPGGLVHFRLDTPGAAPIWGRFLYRTIEPPTRLVWVHGFADAAGEVAGSPFGGAWPLALLTEVTFAAEDDATRVRLRWTPIDATEEERQAFSAAKPSMASGWGGSFEQLDTVLAALA